MMNYNFANHNRTTIRLKLNNFLNVNALNLTIRPDKSFYTFYKMQMRVFLESKQ